MAALLVVSLPPLAYHFRPRSAWDRATPLTSNPVWARGVYDYAWLSPHELVYLKREPGRKTSRALLVDIRTGKQSVVAPALDFSALVSPDGRWLLWDKADRLTNGDWQKRSYHLTALRRPAGQERRIPWQGPAGFQRTNGRARDLVWLPSGKGWVEICWPASQKRAQHPGEADTARMVEYHRDGTPAHVSRLPPPFGSEIEWLLGVTAEGQVLAATDGWAGGLKDGEGSDLLRIERGAAGSAAVRVCHVPMPSGDGWWVRDAELSPDRTHVAWLYKREPRSLVTALLARLHRKYDAATQEYRLRVTDTRGRLVRDLGGQRRVLYNNDLSGWGGVRWMPDGKRLSIHSWNADGGKSTFWTLPAL